MERKSGPHLRSFINTILIGAFRYLTVKKSLGQLLAVPKKKNKKRIHTYLEIIRI